MVILKLASDLILNFNQNLKKKRYGIKPISKQPNTETYVDRAKQRRAEVGVDTSHIAVTETAASSAENSVALKMMKKMGWSEGMLEKLTNT